MVAAINFAVRDFAGGSQYGSVAGDAQSNFIQVGSGDSVSLNLSRNSIVGYEQQGGDLLVRLVDGRTIVLAGYFDAAAGDVNRLYLSTDGEIVEVLVNDTGDGVLFADYGASEGWSKWSPLDDLKFTGSDMVQDVAVASNEPAGMAAFVPGLLGGFGGLGVAAAAGGAAIIAGGLGGGGGGPADPTVDSQTATTVTTNTPDPKLPVSGTGEPGETVTVTIGGKTQTTTITEDGKWSVLFPGSDLPADGNYTATVVVTDKKGETTTLTGPAFVLDMTPPDVSAQGGTKSTGDVENAAEYQNGVSIDGRGEAGATITVEVAGHTRTTTVAANGTWSVTFTQSQIAGGEYEVPVKITATDSHGNTTVLNETLVIDTVPHPIGFSAVTSDNLVNLTETQSGLVVTGTSTAGATIAVTLQGVTQSALVGPDGRWSVTYPAGTLASGEYAAQLSATTTDTAGNVTTSTHAFQVDTLTSVAFGGAVAGDNIINASEAAGGIVMSGTGQPGAAISVAWNGSTLPATVAQNGTWSVTFPAGTAASGTYSSTATVTATDAAGNSATSTRTVQVDTQTAVAVSAGQAGGDNTVSRSESASGLTLTGTAEAGARVEVTFEGVTRTVTASNSGTWSAVFAASEVRSGTYASTVTVRSTDLAGNSATTTHPINVDTEVSPLTRVSLSTGSDSILNATEAAAGLTVTGTVEPGSTVVVRFASGALRSAVVNPDGTWSVTVPAGDIPAGENTVALAITATDRFGNTATLTENVQVDTTVRNFASTGGSVGGDGFVNTAEAAAGLTFTGTAEPGASVVLRLPSGAFVTVTANSSGAWTANFAAADVPRGEMASSVSVTATDRAGNVSNFTQNFVVDTVAPGAPEVTMVVKTTSGALRGIYTEASTDSYSFHEVKADGSTLTVNETHTTADGETNFAFNRGVPDGSYLVVNTADAAANESSTLLVVNNTNAPIVDLNRAGLANFDLSAIDLTVAPQASLTITEAQLNAITGPNHSLIVKGGADDSVTLTGGTATTETKVIDGQTYKLYHLGPDSSVYVDADILTQTTL